MNLETTDQARVGRIVLALFDRDTEKARGIVEEAITEDRLPELLDATLVALVGFLRLKLGDENAKLWATDWVLHAHQPEIDPEIRRFKEH